MRSAAFLFASLTALSACVHPSRPAEVLPLAFATPPKTAALFAPGIISTGSANDELFPAFTPDGNELYFVRRAPGGRFTIMVSERNGNSWAPPRIAPFSGQHADQEPSLSRDGQRLYFTSDRPWRAGGDRIAGRALWMVERTGATWGEPKRIGAPVNLDLPGAEGRSRFFGHARGPQEVSPDRLCFWAERPSDNLGATDIYCAERKGAQFGRPENLGPTVNGAGYDVLAHLDEDRGLLLLARACDDCPDAQGADDLYVSRRVAGEWTTPRNLGAAVNSEAFEFGVTMTPDGRGLLFSSNRAVAREENPRQNIYWIALDSLDLER